MQTSDVLSELAARCEAADASEQRELLLKAWEALGLSMGDAFVRFCRMLDAEAYESAALMLIGEEAFWRLGHDGEGPDPSLFLAVVGVVREGVIWITFRRAVATTPALALTAASLRAAASKEQSDEG